MGVSFPLSCLYARWESHVGSVPEPCDSLKTPDLHADTAALPSPRGHKGFSFYDEEKNRQKIYNTGMLVFTVKEKNIYKILTLRFPKWY